MSSQDGTIRLMCLDDAVLIAFNINYYYALLSMAISKKTNWNNLCEQKTKYTKLMRNYVNST